jgi:tripartite-type tricarboxylate transporter receptor subunit TctC
MKHFGVWLTAAMLALIGPVAAQEAFPSKPVKIIVAFGPGSATDVTARVLAEHMRPFLGGQAVVVENKPGAFGIVAIEEMARSRPDGHTVMIGNVSTSALTPRLYRKRFSIDPEKDVVAISRISVIPGFSIVSAKLPAKTLPEFIEYAKARPGQIRYSTTGVGAFTHYEAEVLSRRAGIQMVHVPMKEGPPAMVRDILAGDVHIASMTMPTAAGLVAAGQLRALVTSYETRLPQYPDIPTMAESGYPGVGTSNWSMMYAPAATPRPVLEALHLAVSKALKSDGLKAAYDKQLIIPTPSASIDEAQQWLKVEMDRWERIANEVKIEIE